MMIIRVMRLLLSSLAKLAERVSTAALLWEQFRVVQEVRGVFHEDGACGDGLLASTVHLGDLVE